jgi:hypothetical protein
VNPRMAITFALSLRHMRLLLMGGDLKILTGYWGEVENCNLVLSYTAVARSWAEIGVRLLWEDDT